MPTPSMTMRSPSLTASARPARIAALWLGIQLVWGAVLGIALQARCAQLAPRAALSLFAVVATAGAFAAAVTQLIAGPWSDHLVRKGTGRIGFYVTGVGAGAIAVIAFFAAPTIPLLLCTFVALQISLNVAIGPYQAIVPDTMPPQRFGIGSAWIAAMQSAGNGAGAVLATLLGTTPLLGVVLAVAMLAATAVTIAHVRTLAPVKGAPAPRPFGPLGRTFVDLFISRALVYVGFYTMLGYLFFFIAGILPRGFPLDATRVSGLAILLVTLVASIGAALAAAPADRLDERLVVSAGASLMGISLLTVSAVHIWPIFAGVTVAAGIGWGIFLCADWALACRVLPPTAMAGSMALWNLAVLGPQILAPPIASAVLVLSGTLHTNAGPPAAIAVAGAEMLMGAAWIWRLPHSDVGN